jgi:TRAP-type mannitol/chloroaromatic compound transport system permease small subunit
MLGAAYTLRHDKHVRVDILYTRLPKRRKAWINAIGTLIFLIPFCLLIIWTSQNYVLAAWRIKEGSPNPGGLPAWYLLKTAIPLGGLLRKLCSSPSSALSWVCSCRGTP